MVGNPLAAVFVGPGGALLTEDEIKQARALEQRKALSGIDTSPVGSWTQGAARVADAIAGAFRRGALDRAEQANQAYDTINYGSLTDAITGGTSGADSRYTTADASAPSTGRVTGSTNISDPNIFASFMDTVKAGGVTNPNALAAIASTGQHESGFSPKNVYGSWSDPSQSGKQLTAGGVMSWNGPRYEAMRNFVANAGGDPNKPDPTLQAQYFLKEDPDLIARLNQAKSPDEAQHLMNNAWRFAGYDRPGGEAGRRISSARMFLDKFGNAQPTAAVPVQTASLDPSVGMNEAVANNPYLPTIAAPTMTRTSPSVPMPLDQMQPMGGGGGQPTQVGSVIPVPSVEAVNAPQPTPVQQEQYQPTNADFTSDPRFSIAPNVPFETQGGGDYITPQIAAAIRSQPEVPASVQRVSAALPIRPQADPNDIMVADMAHTEQPQQPTGQGTGVNYYPPAPSMDGNGTAAVPSAQPQGANTALLVRAMTDPRASEKTRTLAKLVYEKQAAAATAAQKAEADRAQFVFEQKYKEGLPSTQTDIEAKRASTEESKARIADMAKTGNIKDYEDYAAFEEKNGRAPLGPLEYRKALSSAGAPKTVSAPPAGYKNVFDADGNIISQEPIPGGPADTSKKDTATASGQQISSDVVLNAAKLARKAISAPGTPATGTIGKTMASIPESNAAELRRQTAVLKSTATIESLNAMRAQSPTGGALGNVTEGEGAMLAAKAGALDPDSPNFKRDLEDYERTLLRIVNGPESGDEQYWGSRELPTGVTEDDITTTMQKRGMTRRQVMEKLYGGS